MKLLIIYATTEGQTREICNYISKEAQKSGHEVVLENGIENPPAPEGFDVVVLASSIHLDFQESIDHYAKKHIEQLNQMPTIFLTVSLAVVTDEPETKKELLETTEKFLEETGWKPDHIEHVAGALRYSKHNFLKKYIMRLIAQKTGRQTDTTTDQEYTDWDQVKGVVEKIESLN